MKNAVIIGLIPKTSPIATPAKEEWDKVSPIIELRLKTINNPIIGHKIEIINPAKKAFLIKSNWNI